MPNYKDPQGGLHVLDDAAYAYLLPAGCVPITEAEAAALSSPPAPTQAQIIAFLEAAVQSHMDGAAHAAGYDSILSAVSYIGSSRFGPQAVAFRDWRDAVWGACYAIEAAVQAGTRPIPTVAELLAELPVLVLP